MFSVFMFGIFVSANRSFAIVFTCPSGLFWKIHLMDPYTYAPLFVVGTLIATYLVSFAYKNTKFTLKHK